MYRCLPTSAELLGRRATFRFLPEDGSFTAVHRTTAPFLGKTEAGAELRAASNEPSLLSLTARWHGCGADLAADSWRHLATVVRK